MQGVQALTQQFLRLYGVGFAVILGRFCNGKPCAFGLLADAESSLCMQSVLRWNGSASC